MSDPDELAERAVRTVTALLRRGGKLVTGFLLIALSASLLCILIASAAFTGEGRSLALALAVAAAVAAVGASGVARWRLARVTTSEDRLVDEVRRLVDHDQQARQVVIETVEADPGTGSTSVVVWSRQFGNLHQSAMLAPGQFRNLSGALRAVVSLPGLLALSLLGVVALGGLSLIYAIAWAI